MSNPFERARKIRKGELDNEMPPYEELTGWIQRVSVTQLPGLLSACVHACVVQDVFQEGRLLEWVKAAEVNAKDPNSILRKG